MYFLSLVLWGFWKAYKSHIFCFPSVFSGSAVARKPKPTCATPKAVGLPRQRQRRRVSGSIGSLAWHPSPQRRSTTIPMASIRRDMRQQGKTLSGTHIHRKTLRFRCFFKVFGSGKEASKSGFLKNPLEAKDTEWDRQKSVSLAHWSKSIFIRGKPWSFVHAGLLYGQR